MEIKPQSVFTALRAPYPLQVVLLGDLAAECNGRLALFFLIFSAPSGH
jgi:hypothetical protein